MKNSYKKSKKNLLALCLSVLMLGTGAAAFAACSDETTDSSSTSDTSSTEEVTTVNDDGLIKNADFKIGTDVEDKDLTPIFTSVSDWSRSVNSVSSGTALSSKAASGVIDTAKDAWDDLTTSKKNVSEMSDADVKTAWENDELSIKDKLDYYTIWKKANSDGTISEDLDFYEAFNIDDGDIPTCENPGTHYGEDTDKDSHVLMIHNEYPESDSSSTYKALGTAQKYTSSSTVTVPAGTAAEFSVWVKTQDLMMSSSDGTAVPAVGKGAYINVTHSVGSKTLPVLSVCNINTEYIEEGTVADDDYSNGWVKYSFYLKGSTYSDTTFSIVLGLGQGGGTDRYGYVNGYAFFDDIQCELISPDKYDEYADANIFNAVSDFDDLKEDKEFNISKNASFTKFALDFYGDFEDLDLLGSLYNENGDEELQSQIDQHIKATETKYKDEEYVTSASGKNPLPALNGGLDSSNDVTKVYNGFAEIEEDSASNSYLNAVYNDYFKDTEFAKDEKILLLVSANGVAYTADLAENADTSLGRNIVYNDFLDDNGTTEYTDDVYVDYLAISFFIKTSDMNGFTGAGITLKDGATKTSFASLDTSDITTVDLGEEEDIYDGWQQCFFFVENKFENKKDVNFSLSFSFGPTTITGTTKDSYYAGFAAFADFKIYPMNKTEYSSAVSGTYAKIVSVTGNVEEKGTGSSGFDEAANVPSNALETGLANAKNYKGVYNNNYYVNQTSGTTKEINTNQNAGLINKNYFVGTEDNESYYDANSSLAWMSGLTAASGATDAEGVWDSIFGDPRGVVNATQPLMIWNDGSAQTYGYIGSSTTIAANSYTKISVAVKVGADTNKVKDLNSLAAYVYLIDMDDDSYNQTLSIGRDLIYWYDDQGNILTGDPEDKATEIAFKLQTNGLYKANKYWSGYSQLISDQADSYYATLSNYERDPVTGNLLVAEGGATHAYSDVYNHEGENGIAFYWNATTGNFYADKDCTVLVRDIANVTEGSVGMGIPQPLQARYNAEEDKQLMAKVGYTNGEWVHVSFYIHTGDTAKNYRLEVWSGARDADATANPANSYVLFDVNYTGDAESNFTTLIDEHKDDADAVSFESVFSYYDSAKFLRYDASLDENNVGNVYEDSFTPSDYTSGVAYLAYTEGNEQRIFADYSYSEVTVAATVAEDTTTEEETEETETESETNFWLLASSIAIAVVLLLAILSIVIRKIVEKINKGRKKRTRAPKAKKDKKVKAEKTSKEKVDEDSPYND